jgi:uncharacterized protein YgbK (DUF1537 family)
VRPIDLVTVRAGHEAIARFVAGMDRGIVIADAETDTDLQAIARGALGAGIGILAGSAGLARQLAVMLSADHTGRRRAPERRPGGPTLVVAASRHASTAAQVGALQHADVPIVRPSQDVLDTVDASIAPVVDDIVAALAADRSVALTTAGCLPAKLGPGHVASVLARMVAEVAVRQPFGSLVLTGGDVAVAVLRRLQTAEIAIGGEVLPAIPWGILHCPRLGDVSVVTKAGSFGEADALLTCLDFLGG